MKTILASLTGNGGDGATLDAAFSANEMFTAHLDCLFVRPDFPDAVELASLGVFARQTLLSDRLREIDRDVERRVSVARGAFDAICKSRNATFLDAPSQRTTPTVSWRESLGASIPCILEDGRLRELVILGREGHEAGSANRLGTLIMGCGRPVLLAPNVPRPTFARKIAIAWKDTPEAARALTAAKPFLQKADAISVVTVCEDEMFEEGARLSGQRLVEQLKWNGYRVEARHAQHGAGSSSKTLLNEVYSCAADMLVMGAYGHSRVQEFVFGGMTRDVISECALPVMMFH